MLRTLFPSPTTKLSLEDMLELANEYIENASKENNPTKALKLGSNAKSLMKDAEKEFASKNAKGPTLDEGIANAYHEHGKLLAKLGHPDKAQESHSKAEKWGYVHVVRQNTGSSRPVNIDGSIHRLLLPTVILSATPTEAAAMYQDISQSELPQLNCQDLSQDVTPTKVRRGTPSPTEDIALIPRNIFDPNITPPVAKFDLPETNGRITSTPQLAYCLSLLRPPLVTEEELDKIEFEWIQSKIDNPVEQERLHTVATDLIRAFVRDELKKPDVISEVVSLTAVLEQDDFRKLLQVFIESIDQSVLLDVRLLDGLAQLIRNAVQGYIDADDLIKILVLLNARLKSTHKQSVQHTYRLALTISQVLDSMVDSQVDGLSREQLHEPLSDYLKDLRESSDPYLAYQAAYAYQALKYIPDDETILHSIMRRTGKVVNGISGVVSAVKALDLVGFIEGLQNIQRSLESVGKAIELASDAYTNSKALAESGDEFLESLKEGISSTCKSVWYPALRGLDRLLQEGRFAKFEKLVREAPCQRDPAFQWGVCQRLGEIAANPVWDINTRKCAVAFLGELYKEYARQSQQVAVKQWILCILNQLAGSSPDIIGDTQILLQEFEPNGSIDYKFLYESSEKSHNAPYPMMVNLPPQKSPLLDIVQNKPDVETPLLQLKQERLKEQGQAVYIPPRAKVNASATEDFDLRSKVQDFLTSSKKVFLLLGDSGTGKSAFNRALEIDLWHKYDKTDGKIPLFIYLPTIERLEYDLIAERLRKANFTESQIRELKLHREFILICDGYDEVQEIRNLYVSNQLNQLGQWRAQMVISCRTEYIGVDYKNSFRPIDRNNREIPGLFQEAILTPFDKSQIQDYINQYVSWNKLSWETKDYFQALKRIPNLQDLVTNPFLLKIAVDVLPMLVDATSDLSQIRITRVELYDGFVAQWIERGQTRLREMDLSPRDREAFKILLWHSFNQSCIEYLKELATAIYDKQGGNPVVDYSEHRDQKTWKKSFFDNNDGKNLLREAIPLIRNNNHFRFMHKSVLEYGLSLAVFDPNTHIENTEQKPGSSRRGSTSSTLSFEDPDLVEKPATTIEQSLLESPFGRRNFVNEPSISQFLVERVQQQPEFKEQLLAVIEQSKTEKTARIAAANAITVLVRAGVQFIGADLQGVKIPGADLSYGMFDSARFDGADLRKTNLQTIWLRKASLCGAEMTGVQFGELPFLQEDDTVMSCAYWHGGKTLAVGLYNGSVSLYETSSWKKTQSWRGCNGQYGYLVVSEASDWIASKRAGGELQLWDVKTGHCINTLQGHTEYVLSIVFSPNGDKVASGSRDKTVRLWNVEAGNCIHILQGHDDIIVSVAYSPNGDRIASGSDDQTVRLWNVETGDCIHILYGHSGGALSVTYSPSGDQVASGSADYSVRLWDVESGKCIHALQGHTSATTSVAYSSNGDQIVSGSLDGTVRLWNVETGNCVHTLLGHSRGVLSTAYSPNGNQIVSGSYDKTVRLWSVESSNFVHTLQGHTAGVTSVAYSRNGDQVASGSHDKTLRLWNVEAGNCIHSLQGHTDRVTSIAYSPSGDQIVSGSSDMTVRLWNVETGNCIKTLQGHSNFICCVVYSPNGDQIASGSDDHTIRLWDVNVGNCTCILQGHVGDVNSIAYSPNGDQIASASQDETVQIWDAGTGNVIHVLQGHIGIVYSVAYSPNGYKIASGGEDKSVRLWDVQTGSCIRALQGHTAQIASAAYSPNGDWIASGSVDRTARLWDVETGQCLAVISDFNGIVNNIAWKNTFSSQYLVTGSNDKSVRCWRINKEHDEYIVHLCWSSSHVTLSVADASFNDVKGLSLVNQALLSQRGILFG